MDHRRMDNHGPGIEAAVTRDFDFHPDEDTVRCFTIPAEAVLVDDAVRRVHQLWDPTDTWAPDLVLRHYAYADEWFKLNVTVNRGGELIDTGSDPFAINCDIATPMVRRGHDIGAVDLFLDVLVRQDWSYVVIDRDEFEDAIATGIISMSTGREAEKGLRRLLHWIDSGRLAEEVFQFDRATAGRASVERDAERVPIEASPFPEWARRPL